MFASRQLAQIEADASPCPELRYIWCVRACCGLLRQMDGVTFSLLSGKFLKDIRFQGLLADSNLCISLCSSAGMCSTAKYWYIYWTTQKSKKTWGSPKQRTCRFYQLKNETQFLYCVIPEVWDKLHICFQASGKILASLKPTQHCGVTSPSLLTGTDGGCFMLVWATSGIATKVVEEKNTVFILSL